jgi:hypothetical protein
MKGSGIRHQEKAFRSLCRRRADESYPLASGMSILPGSLGGVAVLPRGVELIRRSRHQHYVGRVGEVRGFNKCGAKPPALSGRTVDGADDGLEFSVGPAGELVGALELDVHVAEPGAQLGEEGSEEVGGELLRGDQTEEDPVALVLNQLPAVIQAKSG